jgi:hypothetical protein
MLGGLREGMPGIYGRHKKNVKVLGGILNEEKILTYSSSYTACRKYGFNRLWKR